jgi:hypothetical protein
LNQIGFCDDCALSTPIWILRQIQHLTKENQHNGTGNSEVV